MRGRLFKICSKPRSILFCPTLCDEKDHVIEVPLSAYDVEKL